MTLAETLLSVWKQALVDDALRSEVEGRSYPVRKTLRKGLRMIEFSYQDRRITGIEQNPNTTSRWGELARSGQRIMQFSCNGRYFANVAEGQLNRYGAWLSLRLPD